MKLKGINKMLTEKQIKEIREHLNNAQNPLFFFDNDSDGLCSFLVLQRFLGRGKGVAIKSFPDLSVDYFRKVNELNADYIFILDKPLISKEFLEKAEQSNIPIVYIDHHETKKELIPDFVNSYNPNFGSDKGDEPTTYLCYQVSQKKDDVWIAVAGCITDKYFPDFYSEFKEKYPDLAIDSEDAFEIRYRSGIGKITNLFSFALKDRTTNVVNMNKFLMNVKTPYDVLDENPRNHTMHQRFKQINSKYQILLERAKNIVNSENSSEKILFFKYSGDLSISSDLSNEICFLFPEKLVIVAFVSGSKVNISARGENVRELILKAIDGLKNSSGGGHESAVGAQVQVDDLEEFERRVRSLLDNKTR